MKTSGDKLVAVQLGAKRRNIFNPLERTEYEKKARQAYPLLPEQASQSLPESVLCWVLALTQAGDKPSVAEYVPAWHGLQDVSPA